MIYHSTQLHCRALQMILGCYSSIARQILCYQPLHQCQIVLQLPHFTYSLVLVLSETCHLNAISYWFSQLQWIAHVWLGTRAAATLYAEQCRLLVVLSPYSLSLGCVPCKMFLVLLRQLLYGFIDQLWILVLGSIIRLVLNSLQIELLSWFLNFPLLKECLSVLESILDF